MIDIYEVLKNEHKSEYYNSKFSKGSIKKVNSRKVNRTMYFVSKLQYNIFLYLEYALVCLDIRENFSMIDYDKVLDENEKSLLKAFTNKKTGELYPLTSTFLIKKVDGLLAISAKYKTDFKKPATVRKYYIEKKYWDYHDIPFKLISDREVDSVVVANLENIRVIQFDDEFSERVDLYALSEIANEMREYVGTAREFFLEKEIEPVYGMRLIKFMIFNHHCKCNLKVPFNIEVKLRDFLR